MKKITNYFLFCMIWLIPLLSSGQGGYLPFTIDGYNADVVANGTGTAASSTNNDVDGVSYAFKSLDWKLNATSAAQTKGFPLDGVISSLATSGLYFQLAPYNVNNSIRISSTTGPVTSNVAATHRASKIFILTTGGSGSATLTGTVTFTDNTTQAFSGITVPDWYATTGLPKTYTNFGRINISNNAVENGSGTNQPNLFEATVDITAANQSKFIKSITFNRSGGTGIINIFGVSAEVIETCVTPSAATVSALTATSANMSWTPPATAPQNGYQYELRTSGLPGSGTNGLIATNPTATPTASLTALLPVTTYYFYVRSVCATENGIWKLAATFTTPCGVINTNFFEGFETTSTGSSSNITYPICWSYVNSTSSGFGYVSTSAANNGNNGFYTYRSATANGDLLLISPETANLGNGTKQIRFRAKMSSSTYVPDLRIYTLNGNTATAVKTQIQGTIPLTTNWQEFIVPLPATTDDYFVFSFDRINSTSYVYLDDIYYEDLSPCIFPLNINVANISQTTATISWNASLGTGITGYEYEIRTSGTAGSGTAGLALTGTSATTSANITGLAGGVDYIVYVRSICGTSSGSWTTFPVEFQTLCPVFTSDFFEGFENTTTGSSSNNTVPNCWTYINTTGAGYGYVSTGSVKTGSKSMYTYRTSTANGDMLLISPETSNLGNGTKQIRFWARSTSSSDVPDFRVYTMNGNTATAQKTLIKNTIPLTTTWQEFTVLIPVTTDDYFAFSFDRIGTASYVYVDDINYEDVPPPTLTTTKTNNLCHGLTNGSANVKVTNGVPPYEYLWTPSGGNTDSASNLAAGTYTVTVTDALNRSETVTVSILEPDALEPHISFNNISCNGKTDASISAAPTGGVPPYTLSWSNGSSNPVLSGLAAGTYTLTIKDSNDCSVTESVTITEPAVLATSSGGHTDASAYGANDGSATVSVTGGTAPYLYSWTSSPSTTDTATGLGAGTYTVNVTDANGCSASYDFTIIQPVPLMLNQGEQTNASCNGKNDGTATVHPFGGSAPYTYLWSPSGQTSAKATGLNAGTHKVTVTDADGDFITETFIITEPQPLDIVPDNVQHVSCNGFNNGFVSVKVNGGTAPFSYKWSNGLITESADNLTAGNYSVTVTDLNGCTSTEYFTITEPTVLSASQGNVSNVSCNGSANGSAAVIAAGGTPPYTYVWSNGQTGTASIGNLSGGTYTVTVTDSGNCSTTQSFVIAEPAVVHPPSISTQNLCDNQNATLANINSGASNIKWYSSANGGTPLAMSTVLINGTTYYASETLNGCESAYRTPVLVNLSKVLPITTTSLTVCGNSAIRDITIDGLNHTQLKWYDSTAAVSSLDGNSILTSGTYYISTVNNTCESARKAVVITAQAPVPVPVINAQTVCNGGTVADLVAIPIPGATIKWYTTPQSTMVLSAGTPLSSGTYYAEQVTGSCKSQRVAVAVQIVNVSAPSITSLNLCDGATAGNLYIGTNSPKYVWYISNTASTPLPDTQFLTTGNYYIAQEISGCISNRTKVYVTINNRPGSPTGIEQQTFNFKATVADLKMDQNNVVWFETYDDAMRQTNQLSKAVPLQDGVTYYGALIGTSGCTSLPSPVKVIINLGLQDMDLAQLKYYPNPVETNLNISYAEPIRRIEIYSISGQQLLSKNFDAPEIQLDLSVLSAGTYTVRIMTNDSSKFIKIIKK